MTPTSDPSVLIEEQRVGYIRYRCKDGRRWEVEGVCDRRGHCLVGAVIDGAQVRDLDHLAEIAAAKPGRIDSELDVPVLPGFSGCCPLVGRWLDGD